MSNMEGREPNNAAAEAMRTIQGLRGVNTTLRAADPQNEAPPLDDADFIEDYRRTTGLIIDGNGNVIGKDPNWQGAAPAIVEAPVLRPEDAPIHPTSSPEPEAPALMNGIDLDQGVVVVDGDNFEMTEDEVKGVMMFTSQVMLNAVQRRAMERLKARGIEATIKQGGPNEVPAVPEGQAPGSVPKGQKQKKR